MMLRDQAHPGRRQDSRRLAHYSLHPAATASRRQSKAMSPERKDAMPFPTPTRATRRRLLVSLATLPFLSSTPPACAFGKKSIRDFGKTYDYLKDAELRLKEVNRQRIVIKNADFSGEDFKDVSWGYFDFIDCDFKSSYNIMLIQLADCTFTNCQFHGIFKFGNTRNTRFLRCTVKGEMPILSFSSRTNNLMFEECEFIGDSGDPNHQGGVICHGEVEFINCKSRWFGLSGYKKMVLKECVTYSATLETASPGEYSDKSKMPYSDFLLEDCDFTRGVSMMNPKLNSFTLKNCKVGVFKTEGSVARGDVLVEGVKEGHLDLSASNFQGKLTVRNCSFYKSYNGYSFQCPGIVAAYTLVENITCGSSPANISGAPNEMTEEDRLPKTQNKSLIIRNCKIPHLKVDWAQTEHLRIENCQFDYLDIKDGRIGKLEIIGCTLVKLDVSNTQVKTHDVRVPEGGKISGHV
ncbi:MAG: hypothetical protein LBU11_11440, partial [Zoogloeaceae bacterium]|nr:hypothetical protein [Zoogloeaceae bacterium]